MTTRRIITLGLLTVFCLTFMNTGAYAQSVFGNYGIGELRYFGSVRMVGLGGAGIAVFDPLAQNQINPAMWVSLERVSYGGGLLFEGLRFEQASATNNSKTGAVNNITISAKITPKFAFGGGLRSFSDTDYNFVVKNTEYERTIDGTGGLSVGYFGLAYRPFEIFAVGATFNYLTGVDNETWKINFTDDLFVDTDNNFLRQKKGFGFSVGTVFIPSPRFALGGVLFSEANLETTRRIVIFEQNLDNPKSGVFEDNDIHIPLSFGLGFAAAVTSSALLAGDFYQWNYSDLKTNRVRGQLYKNSNRYSLGMEFGSGEQFSSGSFSGLSYRIGGYYWDLYSRDIDGSKVTDKFLTAGLGIPFNQDLVRMDFGVEGGIRSSSSKAIGSEKIIRLYVSIVGSEFWFIR